MLWKTSSLKLLYRLHSTVAKSLWVKLNGGRPVKVPCSGIYDVDGFVEIIKKKMPGKLGNIDPDDLTLHKTAADEPLDPSLPIEQLAKELVGTNSSKSPLIVKILSLQTPTQQATEVPAVNNKSLWVKSEGSSPIVIPVADAIYVAQLVEIVKKKLAPKLDHVSIGDLTLHKTAADEPLDPSIPIEQLAKELVGTNSSKSPLVIMIGQRRHTPAQWKEVPQPTSSLENMAMVFVNRKEAVEELQSVHHRNHLRAIRGAGLDWVLPLADNVFGLGKSEFGRNYIQKCRETWPDEETRTDFQKTLCACHTICITFDDGELVKDSFEAVMLDRLQKALDPMFITHPEVMRNPPKSCRNFLDELTKSAGPVFIVLDEIGAAFQDNNLTLFEQREKFILFCHDIVGRWRYLKDVFFVLLGRGAFLGYVGLRPGGPPITGSGFKFKRLNIHLLQKDHIREILENTLVTSKGTTNIQKSLNLDDVQTEEAAELLKLKTNGHPRSLLSALRSCKSLEEIRKYEKRISFEDEKLFFDTFEQYKIVVNILHEEMEKGIQSDLGRIHYDMGNREIGYDIIANNAFISWEGNLKEAKLYTPPYFKAHLDSLILPFRDYIRKVSQVTSVSLNYPNVFEFMLIKRFQEKFTSKKKPSEAFPEFFDTPVFGSCTEVFLSSKIRQIPKIIPTGNPSPDLNSDTAQTEKWHLLMKEIDKLESICLKPRPQSSSTDAFLISDVKYKGDPVRLTLGLAAKNYSKQTKLTPKQLDNECQLFDQMFVGTEVGNRKNVLIICCTQYSETLASEFEENRLFSVMQPNKEEYPNIDEVILLDLSTRANRSKFFAVDDALLASLEEIIKKPEVELVATDDS